MLRYRRLRCHPGGDACRRSGIPGAIQHADGVSWQHFRCRDGTVAEITGEHSDAGWATVGSRLDRQPRLTFQRVPEPKTAKVRIHLDIQVDDIGAARQQVEDLGGRWSGERHDYDDGIVVIMHDPENHEFCLVQYYD